MTKKKEYKVTRILCGRAYRVDAIILGYKYACDKVKVLEKIYSKDMGWTFKLVELTDYERCYGVRTTLNKIEWSV